VQIHVDTIFVVLQSSNARQVTAEQLRAAEQKAKSALLENWEAQLDSSFSAAAAALGDVAPEREDADKKNSSLYSAILDKLEVSITGVTFCYYDTESKHTLGASIDALGFSNEVQPQVFSGHTTKNISLQGLSIFLNKAAAPDTPEEASMQIHSYILHPSSVKLSVGYDSARAKWDVSRPKIALNASISSVCLQMNRLQFLAIVDVVDELGKHTQRAPPRQGRPVQTVAEDTRAWWKFAHDLVLEDLRDRKRRRSASYLLERRKSRLRYIELYVRQRSDALSKRELSEMTAMEDQFAFHDLVFFRCSALKRLQDEKKKVLQRKKTPWYSRMVGGITAKTPQDGEQHDDDAAAPLMSLSLEEREALLAAMDVQPHGQSHSHLFHSRSAEQRMYTATLEFDELSVRLVDAATKLDTSATLSRATLQVEGKALDVALNATIKSFAVVHVMSGCTLCRQTGRGAGNGSGGEGEGGGGDDVPLLTVAVQRNRATVPAQTGVCVRVSELDLMFDPVTLQVCVLCVCMCVYTSAFFKEFFLRSKRACVCVTLLASRAMFDSFTHSLFVSRTHTPHVRAHKHTHIHAHTHTTTRTHTRTHTYTHTHTHRCTYTYTHAHSLSPSLPPSRSLSLSRLRAFSLSFSLSCA